jgi:uncharacterized protein
MSAPIAGRDERIDALRGFALGGILLVNIQSFVWGGTNPAGYLLDSASPIDHIAFCVTVALVNLKFMPLFAMLFGASFALLLQRLAARTSAPRAVFRRRLLFLFVFGLLHGMFVYYGDITHMYAVAGLILLNYADRSVPGLQRAVVRWWTAGLVITVLLVWIGMQNEPEPAEVADELQRNFAVLTGGSYWMQWPTRLSLFADIVLANIAGLPITIALMLTGMLAQRAGWLTNHAARAWRLAFLIGIAVGMPASLIYAALLYAEADFYGLDAFSAIAGIPGVVSITLSFAYAATFLRSAPAAVVRWLAPAGRMPLSNYLLQSIAMGALLSGWGCKLAPQLSYTATALLALAIYGAQLLLSRWWLRRWAQGPLEAAWRRWTYAGMPPAEPPIRRE